MKKYLLYLISLIVTILISISCDRSSDPTGDDIDIDMLIGNWLLTQEIAYEVEEWFEAGEHGEDEWLDTFYHFDTSGFLEITNTAINIYYYDGYSPYYRKRIITPYQISGNQLTGNDFLNGNIDYGGGSYFRWSTSVEGLSSTNLVLEFYYEEKEVEAPDWWLYKDTYSSYYDKYSGAMPPASWPDSVVILTDINIRKAKKQKSRRH